MHIFKVLPRYLILYLKSPFLKFYGRYKDSKNNLPLGQMLTDVFHSYCSAIINHRIAYDFFFQFPDNDQEQTVDLTVSRRCSHPHDLILPPILQRSVFALVLFCIFSFGLFDFEHYFSVRYHGNGSQFSILNSLMYSYNSVKKLYDCHFNFKFKMKCCDMKYK